MCVENADHTKRLVLYFGNKQFWTITNYILNFLNNYTLMYILATKRYAYIKYTNFNSYLIYI